jgi:PIN domain nuclease of toxin-antitoxin system
LNRYLLDTHIFLWWLSEAHKLEVNIIDIISNSSNIIYISSASIWEIAIKESFGKLKGDANLDSLIENSGFMELKISVKCASLTKTLEPIHKDPFDRMLIVQAKQENLILITADKNILRYQNVKLLQAS